MPKPPKTSPEILAGMTYGTLLTIKHSDDEYLQVTYAGPMDHLEDGDPKKGKYAGWITVPPYGRGLIETPPCFDTAEEAMEHMRDIIKAAREFDPANANATTA